MRQGALGFLAIGTVLAVVAAVSYLGASSWYVDDACPSSMEQWQCSAGVYGLLGVLLFGPLAAFCLLVAAVLWALSLLPPRD